MADLAWLLQSHGLPGRGRAGFPECRGPRGEAPGRRSQVPGFLGQRHVLVVVGVSGDVAALRRFAGLVLGRAGWFRGVAGTVTLVRRAGS